MVNEQGETKVEKRRPEIIASCELWKRFDTWMEHLGCQALSEGIRAAMKQVTGFDPESQRNSLKAEKSGTAR